MVLAQVSRGVEENTHEEHPELLLKEHSQCKRSAQPGGEVNEVCWCTLERERKRGTCLPQKLEFSAAAAACGFRAAGLEGCRRHASPAACKPQIAERR